jgi:hypothetical protein
VYEADVDDAEKYRRRLCCDAVVYVAMHETQGPALIKFGDVYVAMNDVANDER